jgi:L-iditol 2-dehydrogenase
VILGAGPIGLAQLQLAKLYGARTLIIDVAHYPLQVARELGADQTANANDDDVAALVKAFTRGRGADIVFECAGGESMPKTLPLAVSYCRIGGKVVVVGGFDEGPIAIPLDWQHMQKAEIQLVLSASYSYWNTMPEMQMSLDLLAQGKMNAKKLITQCFPLEKINEAFETAQAKDKNKSIFVGLTL